jgi:iron complex outermembrane receptor protein
MYTFSKTVLCSIFLLILHLSVSAQTQKISGTISDNKGAGLEGVTVKLIGTKTAVASEKNGQFMINAKLGETLEFSSVGFETQKIKIASTTLNIVLTSTTADLQDVILVGSRGAGRVKTESPVPVDVIKLTDVGMNTARMDLTSTLNYVAPSFNYNKQSGADGADHIDIGTLRGLGPDQTLVLINGKRRHSTAFVGLFGTRGRAVLA